MDESNSTEPNCSIQFTHSLSRKKEKKNQPNLHGAAGKALRQNQNPSRQLRLAGRPACRHGQKQKQGAESESGSLSAVFPDPLTFRERHGGSPSPERGAARAPDWTPSLLHGGDEAGAGKRTRRIP